KAGHTRWSMVDGRPGGHQLLAPCAADRISVMQTVVTSLLGDWRAGRRAAPFAGVALAFAFRISFLGSQSLWLDEAVSWQVSGWPIAQIIDFCAAADTQPPGFYLALHFLRGALGGSEFVLRLLSAVAGTLTVALVYRLACDGFG